jgi:hypothetical protein
MVRRQGIVEDATADLFEMPEPNEDPNQEPVFRVTRSTANLVKHDFERYRPSLERMAVDWRESKNDLCKIPKMMLRAARTLPNSHSMINFSRRIDNAPIGCRPWCSPHFNES